MSSCKPPDLGVEEEAEEIMIEAEIIRGQRGSRLLKHRGYIYRMSYQSSWKTHWQCDEYRHRLCRAGLSSFPDGHCEVRGDHNHPALPSEQNNNVTMSERSDKPGPGCSIDVSALRRKELESSRSSMVKRGRGRPPSLGINRGHRQKLWREETNTDGSESGRIASKRRDLTSVGEASRRHTRKRVRRRRKPWEEDDEDIDEDDSSDPTHPLIEKWEPNEEYEVEAIRDVVRNPDGSLRLLVKWKNWPESTNSWEPFSNTKCYDAIVKFLVIRDDSKYMPTVIHEYVQEKFKSADANIVTVCQLLETGFDLKRCLLLDYREKLRLREILREVKRRSLFNRIKRHFGNPLKFVRFVDGQQDLRNALNELQRKFCSGLKREPLVYFENIVDFELTPLPFTAIEDYSFAAGVSPREYGVGCRCADCSNCSCTNSPGGDQMVCQNYTADGRLSKHARTDRSVVFECGPRCCCSMDCYNRVTQRGRPVEVTVFKTGEEKRWGLRPNSAIKAWTFVLEYLGVVKRFAGNITDGAFPNVYEMGMDGQGEPSFVVDSSEKGNVSRFINHSCQPNLVAVKVFNKHRDFAMPRLAFFACRDIIENEELTFDYRSMKRSQTSRARSFGFKCHCQETNCCGEL